MQHLRHNPTIFVLFGNRFLGRGDRRTINQLRKINRNYQLFSFENKNLDYCRFPSKNSKLVHKPLHFYFDC